MLRTSITILGLSVTLLFASCKPGATTAEDPVIGPKIDFTTPGKALNVKVELDKKHSSSGNVTPAGGTVSLTSADGSKFTLEVPPKAVDADTTITMIAVKSLTGAPLDSTSPSAVQLEPSGMFFKEFLTLTVVPAKEIPLKQQVAFGYEGDGKNYHLALVDRKSKEMKIKLNQFSGAGMGSASDAAWAANLQLQGDTAAIRLIQEAAEIIQQERMRELLGDESHAEEVAKQLESLQNQFDDQVVLKEAVAAELDCRFAQGAINRLLGAERQRQLLGGKERDLSAQLEKLAKLGSECKKPAAFQIVGGLDDWQTNTKVCDILKPFTLTGIVTMNFSGGLAGTYQYSGGPFNANGKGTYSISLPDGLDKPGTMTGRGSGQVTGDKVYTGSGTEKYTLTPIEPCN